MARTIQEIMNREVLAVRPDLPIAEARKLLHTFHVGAAPVIDETQRPLGILSLRDVIDDGGTVEQRMSRPALCVDASTEVEVAAKLLACSDLHQMVVVDAAGGAVGVVSTLDLLRALTGVPARHPATFPHWDETTKVSWTDDWPLDEHGARQAPDAPGVLALVAGDVGCGSAVVWVEGCANVRERVRRLLGPSAREVPVLARARASRRVLFRAAHVPEEGECSRIVAMLRDRLEHVPPPGAT